MPFMKHDRVQSPNCGIYKALFPDVLRLEAQRLLRYEAPLAVSENESSKNENVGKPVALV